MATEQRFETVEHETGEPVVASVIWLHGLGADGHDFEPVVPELTRDEVGLRFVFPHAPTRPVTLNQGQVMRAWFDVHGLRRGSEQDEVGIRESSALIEILIRREVTRGIPADRIVLAGFSQGGAIALHAGLRFPERLAGILALSTYLPLHDAVASEASAANRSTPIFQAHGKLDPMVGISLGEDSRDWLLQNGYPVEWKSYAMEHAVCPEEIADIRNWLAKVLPAQRPPS